MELHGVFLPVAEQRCTTNATQPDAAPDDAAGLAEATARTALPVGNGLPWPSPLGACDVASTSGINTSFRVSCESRWRARSGKDKPSCNAGGPRRCWTEPAKTHQQQSRRRAASLETKWADAYHASPRFTAGANSISPIRMGAASSESVSPQHLDELPIGELRECATKFARSGRLVCSSAGGLPS